MLMVVLMTTILWDHIEVQWNTEVVFHEMWSKDHESEAHLKKASRR